jgi:hypothetical protein
MKNFHRYHYLLSALPTLESIGSIPPMSKREYFEQVVIAKGPVQTVETILLSDDLMEYAALLADEVKPGQADFAVLPVDKADAEPVLPAFLLPADDSEESENKQLSADALWSRYFLYADSIARRNNSDFLKAWIGFEVGLRNALVTARSQVLDLDPAAYLVRPELSDTETDYSQIVSGWSAAANPKAAMEVLDKARWDWLLEHGRWYSFTASELEVYAAKLILLHHWRRILSDKQNQANMVQV